MKLKSISNSVLHAIDRCKQSDKDKTGLELAKKLEAEKEADPNWTAKVVQLDNGAEAMRWVRTDELNKSLI